ncbi:hypothetical protein P0D69_11105 [Paraburkholderia sediminicola]|uniref:hypothetical protein n=1 Tax=Paraburkholderia sediminicola TaxID=458836 RepID=UPI0038BB2622
MQRVLVIVIVVSVMCMPVDRNRHATRLYPPRMRACAVWNSYCSTTACVWRHSGGTRRDISPDMTH